MRTGIRVIFGILAVLINFSPLQAATSSAASTAQQDAVKQKLSGMQIPFIENKGQVDKDVAFYAPTFAGTVFVTKKGELVYSLPAKSTDEDSESRVTQVLTERLVAGKATPAPLTAAATKVSYFLGNDRSKWQSSVATHSAVSLGEVWNGIDVELHAYGKNVEKLFTLHPRASVEAIRMQLDGAHALRVAQDGALEVATDSGTMRFSPPVAWQEQDGKKQTVEVAYTPQGKNYGFKLGLYDATRPVIIDPLLQSTYLGGGGSEFASAIAVSPISSEVYVAGYTDSIDFPGTTGGAQPVSAGNAFNPGGDIFIARLNSSLTMLLQTTYLGGTAFETLGSISISPATGELYVVGSTTSVNFPGTGDGARQSFMGINDGFISHLNSDLTILMQSTYIGGSDYDQAHSLAIHPTTGDIYVAGYTASLDLIGAPSGYQKNKAGSSGTDLFISRLDSSLKVLHQSTYLGGTSYEYQDANSLAIHPGTGDIYVTGSTTSTDLPLTNGGAQTGNFGDYDVFVARLNSSLTELFQSTYFGGAQRDTPDAVAISPAGDVFISGYTSSTNLPGTTGGAQTTLAGSNGIFIVRLNSGLTSFLQSTYLGGSGINTASSLAINPTTSDVYVVGYTSSSDFPGTSGGIQETLLGSYDAFIARLNNDLTSLLQATYLGGTASDVLNSIAFHPVTIDVYVAGDTDSTDFPGISGGAQMAYAGGSESFISRLTPSLILNDPGFHSLTTMKSGTGTGIISAMDTLINCGTDCSEWYSNGTVVTLSTSADANSRFNGWGGACSGTAATCTVTMDASKSVTATFNRTSFNLNVSRKGRGSVTSNDGLINCGTDCSETYTARTSVTLTATPSAGYVFTGWSGGGCSGPGSCTVSMNADKTVRATFSAAAVN